MGFRSEAEALQSYLSHLRREFHQHPELSREEHWTCQRIERELDAIGITDHQRVDQTGVYAVFHGGKPENSAENHVITLRCDTDALAMQEANTDLPYCSQTPGKMHACGHDAHTAALLGGAKLLYTHRQEFPGEIRLFFQHAEEIGHGGRVFVREGLLKGSKRVFGIHMASDLRVGTVGVKAGPNNASVDHFSIHVNGKAAHVSTPHLGADALYIASQIVVTLQALVTRRTSPVDPLLIGVGKFHSGTAYNIVAESADLEGTIRAFSPQTRAQAKAELDALCRETAKLYGGTAEVQWEDFAAPLWNDAAASQEASQIVTDLFGPDALISERALSLGGDDFAEFLLTVPGCYAYVGSRNEENPNTTQAHHNDHFDIDEYALVVGAALYAEYAARYLAS